MLSVYHFLLPSNLPFLILCSLQMLEQIRRLKKENYRLTEQNATLERRLSCSRSTASGDQLWRYKEEVRLKLYLFYPWLQQGHYNNWLPMLCSASSSLHYILNWAVSCKHDSFIIQLRKEDEHHVHSLFMVWETWSYWEQVCAGVWEQGMLSWWEKRRNLIEQQSMCVKRSWRLSQPLEGKAISTVN